MQKRHSSGQWMHTCYRCTVPCWSRRDRRCRHAFMVPALADRNFCTTASIIVQAVNSGTARRMQPQRVRKITPTAPGGQDNKHEVPLAIQMAAAGYNDKQQLQLQRAFLEMYSRPDHKVHLSSRGVRIRHGLSPQRCCPACSSRCGTWWTMWSP